jgi:hypothetical protein
MTLEEARKVAELWKEIGHGAYCGDCASDFADECQRQFPDFTWTFVNDENDFSIKVEPYEDQGSTQS